MVTRENINVSISNAAFERLIELSNVYELTRWEMLTRIILTQLPSYANLSGSASPTQRYSWDESLLTPTDEKISYKGAEGERQVTYRITSTAYKKLECHKNATTQSKARIVQSLILNFKPLSKEQRDKQKEYARESRKVFKEVRKSLEQKTSTEHSSKFVIRDGMILHAKGIPPEKWDDDELDEYLRIAGI